MRRALLGVLVVVAAAGLLVGCVSGVLTRSPKSPLAGDRFFVEPRSPAAVQVRRWSARGRRADADALRRIARQPVATWFDGNGSVRGGARTLTERARAAGRTPIIVAFDIPHRDCGRFSAGGAPDAQAYRRWIAALAQGIGPRQAVVILEPDAVASAADPAAHCLDPAQAAERLGLLRAAIGTLNSRPGVRIYLDGGNPGWLTPHQMAGRMRQAGVAQADGFAVNVANFQTTRQSTAYGNSLGRALGGKHYVLDTSRNGNGPYRGNFAPSWCNPPGRALGHAPTTSTGQSLADAYLWIKPPGDSDGSCRPGDPPAGTWWPSYALALARNAR